MKADKYKKEPCGCCKKMVRFDWLYVKVGYGSKVCKKCFLHDSKEK